MTTIEGVATRWVDIVTGKEKKKGTLRTDHIFPSGDAIMSYGFHFEIARLLRSKNNSPRLFLLNGARWSNSTDRHQRHVRSAVDGSKIPKVIIPYGALEAADVDFDSIQLVDDLPEGMETIEHKTLTRPEGSVWRREWHGDYVDYTTEEQQAIADRHTATDFRTWSNMAQYTLNPQYPATDAWHVQWMKEHPEPPPAHTIEDLSHYERRHWVEEFEQADILYRTSQERLAETITVTEVAEGIKEYTWTEYRHWLGESVIRAKVNGRAACKPCKATGYVDGVRYSRAERHLQEWCPSCHGRGAKDAPRWAYFLSGFDVQEPRPLYFFCELPKGAKPTTVAEAYLALKPETVLLGEQMEREVRRQGDIFAVTTSLTKRGLRKAGATFAPMGNLLGTNHEATEVALLDGVTLARGILHHRPGGRRPDHIRRPLGKSWHVIVKNTVPITRS